MRTKIYVGNLPYTCDDKQLRELFGAEGRNVTDVAIITDRMTGQPRGFAFVNMATADDAKRAIDALHGSLFGGRTLTVNEARPEGRRRGWRRRGGGGRGGRDRVLNAARRVATGVETAGGAVARLFSRVEASPRRAISTRTGAGVKRRPKRIS